MSRTRWPRKSLARRALAGLRAVRGSQCAGKPAIRETASERGRFGMGHDVCGWVKRATNATLFCVLFLLITLTGTGP